MKPTRDETSNNGAAQGELPEGWIIAKLGAIATKVGSGATPKGGSSAYMASGTPLIRSMNVHFDGFKRDGLVFLNDKQAKSLNNAIAEPDDVLLNITGASIGRVAQVPSEMGGARVNQHVCIIRLAEPLESGFLRHYLSSPAVQEAIHGAEYGVTRQALTKGQILDFEIPLPPLAEQGRIVAAVEALLARVGAARARLDRAAALLPRFRQAVLAHATTGHLTAVWRDEQAEIETASDLLERVRGERQSLWNEAELAKIEADGRERTNGKWQSKYRAAIDLEETDLPELPTTWRWVAFDEFCAQALYGPRFGANEYVIDGVPTVRTTDMDFRGNITLVDAPKIALKQNAKRHFCLQGNDLLVTRTGATIGKCALFSSSLGEAIASAYLIRYRLTRSTSLPKYLLMLLMSPFGQTRLLGGTQAVAQPNVNTKAIARIPIPLAPLAEQREIVRRVEALFALADAAERRIVAARTRADRLTRAILAKAFRGELVPTEAELARQQNRPYEPAAALLARIRANGSNGSAPPQRKRRRS